jgi:hypothetical protein
VIGRRFARTCEKTPSLDAHHTKGYAKEPNGLARHSLRMASNRSLSPNSSRGPALSTPMEVGAPPATIDPPQQPRALAEIQSANYEAPSGDHNMPLVRRKSSVESATPTRRATADGSADRPAVVSPEKSESIADAGSGAPSAPATVEEMRPAVPLPVSDPPLSDSINELLNALAENNEKGVLTALQHNPPPPVGFENKFYHELHRQLQGMEPCHLRFFREIVPFLPPKYSSNHAVKAISDWIHEANRLSRDAQQGTTYALGDLLTSIHSPQGGAVNVEDVNRIIVEIRSGVHPALVFDSPYRVYKSCLPELLKSKSPDEIGVLRQVPHLIRSLAPEIFAAIDDVLYENEMSSKMNGLLLTLSRTGSFVPPDLVRAALKSMPEQRPFTTVYDSCLASLQTRKRSDVNAISAQVLRLLQGELRESEELKAIAAAVRTWFYQHAESLTIMIKSHTSTGSVIAGQIL